MSLKIPEGIPDSTNLPDGRFDFKNEGGLEVVETGTGKLALKVAMRVTSPKSHKGSMHYEQFTIGSSEDPGAREPETWQKSFGAIACKKMCGKSGVKFEGRKIEEVSNELDGQAVAGRVVYSVQAKFNKDGTENPFAGNARSQVKDWYEVGEQPAAVGEAGAGSKAKPGTVAEPKKAPKAPPPPEDDDDDDAPPAKAKKKAKPEPEDDEEEEAPKAKSKSKPKPAPDDDEDDD